MVHPARALGRVGGGRCVGAQRDELDRLVVRQPELDELVARVESVDGDALGGSFDQLTDAGGRVGVDGVAAVELDAVVQGAVDAWIDAAYLGEYPRSPNAGDPFATFTPRARELAERDRDLLSNAGLAERLDGVEALVRRLQIDVLADDGAAAGVTARLRLDLRLSGPGAELDRDERISGRLFLTYDARAKGWTIFGYEVKRREIR